MLPTVLWLALFLFAIGFFLYIIRGINKNIFLLKNALIWLLISIVLPEAIRMQKDNKRIPKRRIFVL